MLDRACRPGPASVDDVKEFHEHVADRHGGSATKTPDPRPHLQGLDTWGRRSLGACAYHVWHPEGRAFDATPLTRVEADARRIQRFTREGPAPWPLQLRLPAPHPDQPYTLDLRRIDAGGAMPDPKDWSTP